MTRIILIFLVLGSLFFSIVWDDNGGKVVIPDGGQTPSSAQVDAFNSPIPTPLPTPVLAPTPAPRIIYALPWFCYTVPSDGIPWFYCSPPTSR